MPVRIVRAETDLKRSWCVVAATVRQTDESDFGKDLGLIHEMLVTGRKVGAGPAFFAALAHDELLFARVVGMVTGQDGLSELAVARRIMGDNYLGPDVVAMVPGVRFTGVQTRLLDRVPFMAKTLRACRDTHLLVAAPDGLTVGTLRETTEGLVEFNCQPGHLFEGARGFSGARSSLGWYLLRRSDVPGSRHKKLEEQVALLAPGGWALPPAWLVTLAAMAEISARRRSIYEGYSVWTSDEWMGYKVTVGYARAGGRNSVSFSAAQGHVDVGLAEMVSRED
jgi:hypothetical protein